MSLAPVGCCLPLATLRSRQHLRLSARYRIVYRRNGAVCCIATPVFGDVAHCPEVLRRETAGYVTTIVTDDITHRPALPLKQRQELRHVARMLAALWRALPHGGRSRAVTTVGVMLLSSAAELGMLLALKGFLVDAVRGTESRLLLPAVLTFSASVVTVAVTRLATLKLQDVLVLQFASDASCEIFSRALRQPYLDHVKRESSELFVALENMQRLVNGALGSLLQALVSAVLAIGLTCWLLLIVPSICVPVVGGLVVVYAAVERIGRARVRPGPSSLRDLAAARLKIAHEAQSGFRDLVLTRAHDEIMARFGAAEARYRRRQAEDRFHALAPRHVIEAVSIIGAIVLLALLSSRASGIAAAIPTLGAAALGMQRLLPLLHNGYAGWRLFLTNSDVIDDVLRMMRRPALPTPPAIVQPLPFAHHIVLDDIGMHYDHEPVLRGIDLVIRKGEHVGLVGPSGGGKSTLVDIILGLVRPTSGRLLVDGNPIDSDESRWAWQARIACVAQHIYLPDASVREVITGSAVAGERHEARLEAALRGAHLQSFVTSLPLGVDTRIGDGGALLSGGQRQRVAVARALYRKAQLLILDEATSQLDAASESDVLDTLDALRDSLTVLIVTHRETTLRGCDRVVEIRRGTLMERPTALSA